MKTLYFLAQYKHGRIIFTLMRGASHPAITRVMLANDDVVIRIQELQTEDRPLSITILLKYALDRYMEALT